MKDQFIPYSQALILKQLGFDEPCMAVYKRDGSELSRLDSIDYDNLKGCRNSELKGYWFCIAAPLWQQAFDWLLKKLGGSYTAEFYFDKKQYCNLYLEDTDPEKTIIVSRCSKLNCLNNMIKLVKKYKL